MIVLLYITCLYIYVYIYICMLVYIYISFSSFFIFFPSYLSNYFPNYYYRISFFFFLFQCFWIRKNTVNEDIKFILIFTHKFIFNFFLWLIRSITYRLLYRLLCFQTSNFIMPIFIIAYHRIYVKYIKIY